MGKTTFMTMLLATIPVLLFAQDDLYFVPTKKNVEESARDYGMPRNSYYSGSNRSVDEYNRRGTYVQELDSAGNDIITFSPEHGVYPDSMTQDFECTRNMCRFDDYDWTEAYNEGWRDGVSMSWGYYDPWYYAPWYYGHWSYSGWYGWRRPWHYGWYGSGWYGGWYRPYWYYGWHSGWYGTVSHRRYRSVTGTSNHGVVNRRGYYSSSRNNSFNGYRGSQDNSNRTTTFGGNRNSSYSSQQTQNVRIQSTSSSGGSRGTFGGGGGSYSGGSRSGGGSFGGRR